MFHVASFWWVHSFSSFIYSLNITRSFIGKVLSLLFNMLCRLVITFLPRSKHLLISWLQSPSAVTLEPPKIKSVTIFTVFPSICHEVMGPDAMTLVFWTLSFKPTFSLSSFTFIKRLFSSSSLYVIKVVSSTYLGISVSSEYSGLISLAIGWISLQSKGLSRVFSNTAVQKHQFFSPQLSSQSNSHICTWLLEKP